MIARFGMLFALAASVTVGGCIAANGPAKIAASSTAPDNRPIVAMRRLTEPQYRNSIADIFGSDIKISGRFDPIVRPVHQLIASGAATATISPAGMEQFDSMGRSIAAQVLDEEHRRVFVTCSPRLSTGPDTTCAEQVLRRIGRLVFRRPLTEIETVEFVRMAETVAKIDSSFNKGVEIALAAMLISPNFLYIIETSEPDPERAGSERLDDYSRAARLSYMLWNTTPDTRLLDAADRGDLRKKARYDAIASEMVASPRVKDGVRAFFADMLLFEKFEEMSKDPIIYPRFNADVAKALPEQMLRTIVDHLIARNGDYRQLFTTRQTFVTRSLGPLYQLPVSTKDWVPYEIKEGDSRAGLLGQAGFLALYSHSGRSSATLRGRAVRELLMCQPVPDPPGNVNFTAVQNVTSKAMPTARMRLSEHSDNPVCAGCHKITDPIGLALENFDGIGTFRREENGAAIDTRGKLDGSDFSGLAGLGARVAESESTTSCLAGRAVEYATGRRTDAAEEALVQSAHSNFVSAGYRFPALLLSVATMPEIYRVPVQRINEPHQMSRLTMSATKAGGR